MSIFFDIFAVVPSLKYIKSHVIDQRNYFYHNEMETDFDSSKGMNLMWSYIFSAVHIFKTYL